MHLNYMLAFDGIIACRGGIPLVDQGVIIGAIGSSGGADSQNEVLSKAGAAVIKKLRAEQMMQQQEGSSIDYLSNLPASQ
jgi:Haem-degrading